ncbi:TIGR02206 family membrane protein [Paenibacillus sp. BSR1-1]|uniref:YwaF family protein n=1 Tax=Paenibacillus sp. BSR1-1 TaxID=3020845 RepID=UPI0025B196E7|nr:TIGR02206 family membrane protein [Paenibacillus sp. BSR1-1]MDN3016385.1 TIGR02206 family membrane protein [Paenibacillus sp. BSR1-1]
MNKYFKADGEAPFILFSLTHLLTLSSVFFIVILIYLIRKPLRAEKLNFKVRTLLATVLILSEISLHIWLWRVGEWTIQYSLPFHLSSISIILSAALLLTKSSQLFEFTYFAGVGSALQAMITPDLSLYTFPHFRYVHFFISHGGIVVANMFFVFVEQYKPKFKSIWKAFLYLNLYTCFVFLLNYFVHGNYMYISEKPMNPSILDYLGRWPYYLIPLEIIALITFFILYLPFGISYYLGKNGSPLN